MKPLHLIGIIAIIIFVLLISLGAGLFLYFKFMPNQKMAVADAEVVQVLDSAVENVSSENTTCSIIFNKYNAIPGETVTGTLKTDANSTCEIYFKLNSGDWRFGGTVVTDEDGFYTESRTLAFPGEYQFSAICGDCVTGTATLLALG